jgi:serine-aspartate repeat-containing protein C/D/E
VSFGNVTIRSLPFIPDDTQPVARKFNISGYKINDMNGDGKWNIGEQGIGNWKISLINATTGIEITNTTTDNSGFYRFSNLLNGTYNVTEETRSGFKATNNIFLLITLLGKDVTNQNFMNQPIESADQRLIISGYKINDTNGNGKWDLGEKGIPNWTIRLIGIIGKGKNTNVIRKVTTTDAMGLYKFDNLPEGRYFVIEKHEKGFVPTSSPVKRIKLAHDKDSLNNNFTNRPVHSLDKKNGQIDKDDYEEINKEIDKYKEDMDWN